MGIFKLPYESVPKTVPTTGIVVLGASFCGWCQKQKEELNNNNVDFKYVECTDPENASQCSGVSSYPTVYINGKMFKGFMNIDKINSVLSSSV
jgi:glutaredoxin